MFKKTALKKSIVKRSGSKQSQEPTQAAAEFSAQTPIYSHFNKMKIKPPETELGYFARPF